MSFEILPTPALETSTEHTVAAPCLVACFVTGNTRNACSACCACCNSVLLEAPPSKSRVQEIVTISTKIEVCLIVKHTDIPYSHIETPLAWLPISLHFQTGLCSMDFESFSRQPCELVGSHLIKPWDPGTHCQLPALAVIFLGSLASASGGLGTWKATRVHPKCSKNAASLSGRKARCWKKNLGNFFMQSQKLWRKFSSTTHRVRTSFPYSTIVILKFDRPPRATWAPPSATWLQVGGMRIPTMAMR